MRFFKICLASGLAMMLSACGTTNLIQTGIYQSGVDGVEPHGLNGSIELLHVNAKTMQVQLQVDGKIVQAYTAVRLSKNQWREGCPTNFTTETMEKWQLRNVDNSQTPPVFLLAACMGDGVVIDTGSRTILFGTPE